MAYLLVDEDFLAVVAVGGYFIGVAVCYWFVWMLRNIQMRKVRDYFMECGDADKKSLLLNLENIKVTYEFLVLKTNTRKMRRELNKTLDLINYLSKKKLD